MISLLEIEWALWKTKAHVERKLWSLRIQKRRAKMFKLGKLKKKIPKTTNKMMQSKNNR